MDIKHPLTNVRATLKEALKHKINLDYIIRCKEDAILNYYEDSDGKPLNRDAKYSITVNDVHHSNYCHAKVIDGYVHFVSGDTHVISHYEFKHRQEVIIKTSLC